MQQRLIELLAKDIVDAGVYGVAPVRFQLEHHPMLCRAVRTPTSGLIRGRGVSSAYKRVQALLNEERLRNLLEDQGLTYIQIADGLDLRYNSHYLARLVSRVATQHGIRPTTDSAE
jgi:hypothetical protein